MFASKCLITPEYLCLGFVTGLHNKQPFKHQRFSGTIEVLYIIIYSLCKFTSRLLVHYLSIGLYSAVNPFFSWGWGWSKNVDFKNICGAAALKHCSPTHSISNDINDAVSAGLSGLSFHQSFLKCCL